MRKFALATLSHARTAASPFIQNALPPAIFVVAPARNRPSVRANGPAAMTDRGRDEAQSVRPTRVEVAIVPDQGHALFATSPRGGDGRSCKAEASDLKPAYGIPAIAASDRRPRKHSRRDLGTRPELR